jgi:hypothetical protein
MVLVLGVAASVVANVLHALDNPISQSIAAWPPLALLLTVELISRVPVHRRSLAGQGQGHDDPRGRLHGRGVALEVRGGEEAAPAQRGGGP